jgi:hypothetical protein
MASGLVSGPAVIPPGRRLAYDHGVAGQSLQV